MGGGGGGGGGGWGGGGGTYLFITRFRWGFNRDGGFRGVFERVGLI